MEKRVGETLKSGDGRWERVCNTQGMGSSSVLRARVRRRDRVQQGCEVEREMQ